MLVADNVYFDDICILSIETVILVFMLVRGKLSFSTKTSVSILEYIGFCFGFLLS